ncbi:MAG: hypothetical protein QNJ37_16325 [Crocosphaera sp.]|nr:hypothetical protein [Crocosphaera sp.]
MKKIKVILFSFLLMLGCLLIPNKVLADSLPANQITFSENYSTLANKKQSLENKIAQVEGNLAPSRLRGKPWEGLKEMSSSPSVPVEIIKQWRCNGSGRYVSVVNFDDINSYQVWVNHTAYNIDDDSHFHGSNDMIMEPSSKWSLGCTVSLGYDGEPEFLNKWVIDKIEQWE